MHQAPAHAHPSLDPHRRTMADLWNELPADPGMLTSAISQQLASHAPVVPVHLGTPVGEHDEHPTARLRPYADPLGWLLIKHAVQLALVASVLLLVVFGGDAPLMSLAYVATGLLMMGTIVIADRQRFADRDPGFEIVEFIAPPPRPAPPPEPAVRQGALVPLVQQMQAVLPERVDVT